MNLASSVEIKTVMGDWLGDLVPWDAYATWTFSRIVTPQGAMFWAKRHIEWLEKAAEQKVYGFVAAERGASGGLIHLHALLGNVKHMQIYCGEKKSSSLGPENPSVTFERKKSEKKWARLHKCCLTHAWPCGYAHVFPYNPALGAKHYVAKYITKDLAEWDLFGLPLTTQTAFGHKGAELTQS